MTADSDIHPIDLVVGRNIRALRLEARISQARLGAEIGVSFQQVQKYETAANRLSASALFLAAGLLKVPVEALFEGLPPPSPAASSTNGATTGFGLVHDLLATPGGGELARAFLAMPKGRRRAALVQLAQAMAWEDDESPIQPRLNGAI